MTRIVEATKYERFAELALEDLDSVSGGKNSSAVAGELKHVVGSAIALGFNTLTSIGGAVLDGVSHSKPNPLNL